MKLCKHCKFFRKSFLIPARHAKCGHAKAVRFNGDELVDGSKPERKYCSSMRDGDVCGREGSLWELQS